MTKLEKEKYELIERYINNDLSPQELKEIQLKIQEDADFAKEVKAHSEVHQLMMDGGLINIKKKLKKIHQSEINGNDGLWKYFSGVTIVIIISTIAFFYQYHSSKNTSNEKTIVGRSDTAGIITKPGTDKNTIGEKEKIIVKESNKVNVSSNNVPIVEDTEEVRSKPVIGDPVIPEVAKNGAKDFPTYFPKENTSDKFNCSDVTIKGSVTATETCEDNATGNIIVQLSSLNGGAKPYKFSISAQDEYSISSQFSNLPAGHYKVMVKDKNECISVLQETDVKSKSCLKEFSFYPDREVWAIPLKINANAEIKILNSRVGSIVYTATINNGYPDSWNGTDNSGVALPMGNYSFLIIYTNGEITRGAVTIMR